MKNSTRLNMCAESSYGLSCFSISTRILPVLHHSVLQCWDFSADPTASLPAAVPTVTFSTTNVTVSENVAARQQDMKVGDGHKGQENVMKLKSTRLGRYIMSYPITWLWLRRTSNLNCAACADLFIRHCSYG